MVASAPAAPLYLTPQLKFLVSDLRYRLPINIADIRHYMTAPGGFHANCLQRTESG
jgi:hypothetical protein